MSNVFFCLWRCHLSRLTLVLPFPNRRLQPAGRPQGESGTEGGRCLHSRPNWAREDGHVAARRAVFSFLYLKKIKISKIYVGFGKFQKYTPVALWGATGLKCNFFSSNLQRSPWRKKRGPVAYPRGDRALSPVGGATGSLPLF